MDMDHLRGGERPPNSASKACRSLMAKQFGLITRDQALGSGLTARQIEGRVRRDEWALIYRGVYADRAGAHSWRRSVLAAVLTGGPDAVASGSCAAALLSLPGFRPVAEGQYRIDFAFPHAMVAVEAQGYRWHSSRRAWERDISKANALTGLGWMVVYVTWSDLKDESDSTVAHLRDLLLPRFL